MTDHEVPIWALTTAEQPSAIPRALVESGDEGFTPERLERVRRVLAAYADNPPVLLERHAVVLNEMPPGSRALAASSPVAKALHEIVGTTKNVTAPERAAGATGTLYRMVVPKELAGDLASGLARPMKAAGTDGGVYSGILGKAGLVANAKFVPVAASGGAAGAAATTTAAATIGGAAVAAASFVILLVATAASIHAEEERRRTLERLQSALDEIRHESLEKERDELNGAVSAIANATAILADEGRLGLSLGLDSAVNTIDVGISTAERRIGGWEKSLAGLGTSATPSQMGSSFSGIADDGGEFITQLRMVIFAIASKRRIAVLQAAEHTQLNPDLSLSRFAGRLRADMKQLAELEDRVTGLLHGISAVAIVPSARRRDVVYRPQEVRKLLEWGPRLHAIARTESPNATSNGDVELALVVPSSGPIRVLAPIQFDPQARRG